MKKVSQREANRRREQSQAQWEKDNAMLVYKMAKLREQWKQEDQRQERRIRLTSVPV